MAALPSLIIAQMARYEASTTPEKRRAGDYKQGALATPCRIFKSAERRRLVMPAQKNPRES